MERRNLAARPRRNLAARAGRWSAKHRKTAIWGWIVFVVLAVFAGGAIGTKTISDEDGQVGEAGRAERVLADRFEQPAPEQVLVQSSTLRVADPRFRAGIDDVITRLGKTRDVESVHSPLWPENAGQISRDRHSVLIDFEVPGDPDTAKDRVDASLAATAALQRSHPQLRIAQFGSASAEKAFDKSFSDDLTKAGRRRGAGQGRLRAGHGAGHPRAPAPGAGHRRDARADHHRRQLASRRGGRVDPAGGRRD